MAVAAIAATTAHAQSFGIAGRVIDVRGPGAIDVVHVNGRREPVRYPLVLRPGDRFEFKGQAELTANIYGKEVTISPTSGDRMVPLRRAGRARFEDENFFQQFELLLSQRRQAIPAYALARGDDDADVGRLTSDPLAPSTRQMMPTGSRRVVLIWRGASARLFMRTSDSAAWEVDSGTHAWAVIEAPGNVRQMTIRTQSDVLTWDLTFEGAAPSPPWFQKSASSLSDTQRLVRALWILQGNAPDWRIFALTELAEMAGGGDFAAEQLWRAARSGELAAALEQRAGT